MEDSSRNIYSIGGNEWLSGLAVLIQRELPVAMGKVESAEILGASELAQLHFNIRHRILVLDSEAVHWS